MRVLLADSDPSSKCCCRETHSLEPFSCLARAKFLLHAETTAICIKTEAFYLFDHEMGSKQRRNISFCPKISSKAKNIKAFPYWDNVSVSFSASLSHSCNIILQSKVSPSSPSITQHVTCLTCCLLTLPISVPLHCSLLFFLFHRLKYPLWHNNSNKTQCLLGRTVFRACPFAHRLQVASHLLVLDANRVLKEGRET